MAFDGKAFGKEIVEIVKTYVRGQLEPLQARIAALEAEKDGKASKPVIRIAARQRKD
ncbi:hypothetical protein [Rhizobium phaseoli]|uniref:hypothetical protein n=1 Tax=Rhizobium phaseoli TaxID=396 RepID=UPI0002F2225F|nr:hypothetical protein [Rhizobium phaseoli]